MSFSRADDRELLDVAVRAAGQVALRYFRTTLKSWDKNPGDPVSEADLAVNTELQDRLMGARPDYGWLSEENPDDAARLSRPRVWIVDPIDGTRSFIEGKDEFCVSVALVEHGQPVLAALFNPATEEYFSATLGAGAKLNGAPIRANADATLAEARILGGKKTFTQEGWLAQAPRATFGWRNSIAYRLALVAADRYDAVISLGGKNEWDIAAADLVLREAGAVMTTAQGEPFGYNRPSPCHGGDLLAAPPALHADLLRLFARRGKSAA